MAGSGKAQHVVDLVNAGRFSSALKLLRQKKSELTLWDLAVEADLLQRTGCISEARELANDLLRRCDTPKRVTGLCHLVLGTLEREHGNQREAVTHLRRAVAILSVGDDLTLRGWASLRLMLAVSDGTDCDAMSAELARARRDILAAADPQLLSALHVFVAQLESRRGLLEVAREHIRIGRILLDTDDNLWLKGTADIASACVNYLSGDFVGAEADAKSALMSSQESGHVAVRRAALADLGHVCLVCGKYGDAARWLNDALAMSPPYGDSRVGILDGMAQLHLIAGELDACENILYLIEDIAHHPSRSARPCEMWHRVTKARSLIAAGEFSDALAVATSTNQELLVISDPNLRWLLECLSVEALVRLESGVSVQDRLWRLVGNSGQMSTEVVAELLRVTGLYHVHAGDRERGWACLARAARILAAIGHSSARTTVVRELRGLLEPSERRGFDAAEKSRPPWPAVEPDWPAPRSATARNAVAATLDRSAAICDFAAYPEILAAEAACLCLDAAATRKVALVIRSTSGRKTTAVTWNAPDTPRTGYAGEDPATELGQPVTLELGRRRDVDFQLLAYPHESLAARSTVLAVKTLVDAACALETVRREKRESTALWPIESDSEQSRGIFISEKMTELVTIARKIATSDATVLLTGETGTGKEVLARLIHDVSPAARQPFVPFNCSSVPRDLVDSQLFGYRRGAFTGAVASFPGVIRAAAGGTLFLDEIGDLAPEVQPKLLRFLESGEIHPLGEAQPVQVKLRVVAATNADLAELVGEGRFREDLFYRLNVIPLHLPPLRERREEIPPLVDHYLSRFAAESRKGKLRVADETMEYLLLWKWPGNVRELVNEVRRLVALAEPGAVLMPEHLSRQIVESRRTVPAADRTLLPTEIVVRLDQPHGAMTEHAERSQICWAFSTYHTREEVARGLGLSRKGLYLKCRRLGIDPDAIEAKAAGSVPTKTADES